MITPSYAPSSHPHRREEKERTAPEVVGFVEVFVEKYKMPAKGIL
jgi:hypothetical protein